MGLSRYRLQFLKGTSEFVLEELLEKYPKAEILENDSLSISFSSEENNIEVFRNLYSPTHIEVSTEKISNPPRGRGKKELVPPVLIPSHDNKFCMLANLIKKDIL